MDTADVRNGDTSRCAGVSSASIIDAYSAVFPGGKAGCDDSHPLPLQDRAAGRCDVGEDLRQLF